MQDLTEMLLGLQEFFSAPEIKAAKTLEEFSDAAPQVIARMSPTNVSDVE
jgi:hypothetical protein